MARKTIDIGAIGNDGTGDSIRDSFRKVNDNFRELYSSLGLGENLTFIGLDDTPATFVGQNDPVTGSTPLVTVNNTESGLAFKRLVPGSGISIDYITNPNEITINSEFSEIVADPTPQLGGDLSLRSGGLQYRIVDAGTTITPLSPIFKHELVNKAYADSKIARAGVNAINPETGQIDGSFGTMSGPLILSRSPEPEDDQIYGGLIAATKQYVDSSAFGSTVNLYVALSGLDYRPGVSKALQGRALAYAYRTLEAALKRAEELVLEGPAEIGPYKKTLTFNNGQGTCTLDGIGIAPGSGSDFAGVVRMSIDTAEIVGVGVNYYPGDELSITGGAGTGVATIRVLTTVDTPGAISTFRIISTGIYTALPGASAVATTISTSAAPPGIGAIGVGATFNLTYKVASVAITNGGTGYSLVSVRITGGGGAGAFGTAVVTVGVVTSITITDKGSGFTSLPTLEVTLPRFRIRTDGFRTDFTGDVLTNTPEAIRGRDIREGLFLRGETSGALAQILSHSGALDSDGNEIFDVDIKFGNFIIDEVISYGDISKSIQISILVESGEYYENYPLKVPQNCSIVGDEFRRCVFRPAPGVSSSPWAFQKFRRDRVIDGLPIATKSYAHHYLSDIEDPVYPPINNPGNFSAAAALLDLNILFLQKESVAWINNSIATASAGSIWFNFQYDPFAYEAQIALLVESIIFDLKYGEYNRTISAALKFYQGYGTNVSVTVQLDQYKELLIKLNQLMQSIIDNTAVAPIYNSGFPQVIDQAFVAEVGSDNVISSLIITVDDIIDESGPGFGSVNTPKLNEDMDVFLANDSVRWQAITAQGHGGFMGVLDPTGQILAKSPYFQECASFSRSKDRQVFAGGMFVDGFTGNLQFRHNSTSGDFFTMSVSGLDRFPQLPCSFLVEASVFRINYVRDFVYDPAGSTANFVLDDTNPFTRPAGAQTCTISFGAPAVITRVDHRLQPGATLVFSTTGTLPDGIVAGQEYFVVEDGFSNNTFNITESLLVPSITIPIATVSRVGSLATVVTSVPHLLASGATVDINNTATVLDDDNAQTITVINDTTFTYASNTTGAIGETFRPAGRVVQTATVIKVNTTSAGSGTHSYQRIYELLMPGNRSLLCNDFTQINDLGYGILATNGGLVEAVSMFTYYCHISYYALNGAQIRSVGGSSAHGNYALVAEGFDPLEVPTPTTVFEDFAQKVKCYNDGGTFTNTVEGLFVFVYAYDYLPLGVSELEVDHGGILGIFRYPVVSVTLEDNFPVGVVRLNLTSGQEGTADGLAAVIPDNTVLTLRINGLLILTGGLENVAVRPSTGLKLRETGSLVYRVLLFSSMEDENGPYPVSITNASPAVIKILVTITDITNSSLCTTAQNHKLKLGDKFIPTSTANGFVNGTTYFVTSVPEYNQFTVSTSLGGSVETLTNGSALTIQGVKTHKLLENYIISFATTGTLPTGMIIEQEYFVLPDGLTDTEFTISLSKSGVPINTTSAGTGTFTLKHEGLTKTNLRENYDYIELSVFQPGVAATYSLVASDTTASTDLITLSTISYQVKPGMPVVFAGTTFGGIVAGTIYYVRSSPFSASIPIATVERTGTTATIVTSVNHGLASGQTVDINTTATALDSDNAVVITVTNATTFTYTSGASGTISVVAAAAGRVIADSKITVSATQGGAALTLSTASGTMTAIAGGDLAATITIAPPGVITATAHGFAVDDVIRFKTTGALPAGLSANRNFFVQAVLTADTFTVAAVPGAASGIATTGTQTGTHTVSRVQGRAGDSTFAVTAVPDQSISRVAGSRFMFKGEEYIVTQYDPLAVTNEIFGRVFINRPLVDSIVAFGSAYTAKSAVSIRTNGAIGNLTIRISLTRVTSHDLLEIGTGSYADTNYPKEIYGPSVNTFNEDTEVEERDVGRVFFVTTDQFGNFKVGPFFKVDQGTGTVTFAASIALSNLDGIGFKRGVPISEFSTDSGFTDNATDTVPTENAARIYIERRLGVTHDGSAVGIGQLIPAVTGGFMPLSGILPMKGPMNMADNKIVTLGDATDPQDAVNLRSLTFDNFQNFTATNVQAADTIIFTGAGNSAVNARIIGDITFDLQPGVDSALNQVNAQIVPGAIINTDVNAAAAIAYSKLNLADSLVNADVNSAAAIAYSKLNLTTSIVNGDISVSAAIAINKLAALAPDTLVGNSSVVTASPSAVAFSTVIDEGLAIKKNQYSAQGFLKRTSAGSFNADANYGMVDSSAGSSSSVGSNLLIQRSNDGDFGGRTADLQSLKIDDNLAIDTLASGSGGYIRYYGYNSVGGILIQSDTAVAANNKIAYWNDAHEFKNKTGGANAPITAVGAITSTSTGTFTGIQCTAITTGGNTIAGTITGRWTLTGTSPNESRLQATYSADLAENYEGDKLYDVGTVLVFGGDKEVTTSAIKGDTRVAGVVSNTAAYTMFEACPGLKNLVALQGRVPCRVVGKIKKGDILVTSGIPGVATAAIGDVRVGTVVGKAIKDYDSDHIGLVEIAVGRT
jgi:hypothetical protein